MVAKALVISSWKQKKLNLLNTLRQRDSLPMLLLGNERTERALCCATARNNQTLSAALGYD